MTWILSDSDIAEIILDDPAILWHNKLNGRQRETTLFETLFRDRVRDVAADKIRHEYPGLRARLIPYPESIGKDDLCFPAAAFGPGGTAGYGHAGLTVSLTQEEQAADVIPERELIRATWCMHCTSWKKWYVALLLRGESLYIHELDAGDTVLTEPMLMSVAQEFRACLDTSNPPQPRTGAGARLIWPQSLPDTVIAADDDMAALVANLRDLKNNFNTLERTIKDLERVLRPAFGNAEDMIYKDRIIATYRSPRDNLVFDEERFAKDTPNIYRKYQKLVPGPRRLIIRH